MKTISVKQVMSIAAFGLAIAAAFTSNAAEKNAKTAALIPAHKKANAAGACDLSVTYMCEDFNTGNLCRVSNLPGAQQVFAPNQSQTSCVIEVWRPQQ